MSAFVNKFRFCIQKFSVINKSHNGQIIELGFPLTFDAMEYLMEKCYFALIAR